VIYTPVSLHMVCYLMTFLGVRDTVDIPTSLLSYQNIKLPPLCKCFNILYSATPQPVNTGYYFLVCPYLRTQSRIIFSLPGSEKLHEPLF